MYVMWFPQDFEVFLLLIYFHYRNSDAFSLTF